MLSRNQKSSARRHRTRLGLLTALLVVGAALGLASCSTSATGTVTLVRSRPGEATTIVAHGVPSTATNIQIRFTSGSGRSIQVQPYRLLNGVLSNMIASTAVVDDGTWTTVSPVYGLAGPTLDLQYDAYRFTTAAPGDVSLSYEVRAVAQDGVTATWPVTTVSPFGADCALVQDHADLSSIDLSGRDLQACVIPGVTLDPAKLTGTNLRGADLSQATIKPGALHDTKLTYARLGNATLKDVDLTTASITNLFAPQADFGGAVLRDAHVQGSDLTGAALATATLTGISSGAVIGTPTLPAGWVARGGHLIHKTADLSHASLAGVDLAGLDLAGVNLQYGYLPSANLAGTDLTGADLTNAVLSLADVTGTKLASAQLTGVGSGLLVGTPASLPAGWSIVSGYLVGPGADLAEAHLAGVDLHGRDLRGIGFARADLTNADLRNTNLSDSSFSYATIAGTDLRGANLTHADLNGATGTPVYVGVDFATATCPDGTLGSAHGNTCQGHPWP